MISKVIEETKESWSDDYIRTDLFFEGHHREQWIGQYKASLWVPEFAIEDLPHWTSEGEYFQPRGNKGTKVFKKKEGCYRGGKDKRVQREDFSPGTIYNIPAAVRTWSPSWIGLDFNTLQPNGNKNYIAEWMLAGGAERHSARHSEISGYINLPALCVSVLNHELDEMEREHSTARLSLICDPRYSFEVYGRTNASTLLFRHRKK